MAKRQSRYFTLEIEPNTNKIIGKMAHVVLNNNSVFSGKIESIQEGVVILKTAVYHTQQLPINIITELITDQETPY
jgi:hypothetical protein